MTVDAIEQSLEPYGLRLRGIVALEADEIRKYELRGKLSIALVGNIGSSFWSEFVQSKEYADGDANPLDRWSLRIANKIAPELNATPVFPFQGPPYLPFQRWAKRAEALHQSPLGLMIHPKYGLWHAYRFGLLISQTIEPALLNQDSPCLDCIAQPCLNTCPVKAFSPDGYDVDSCAKYLKQNASSDCFQHGCMARFVCPAGREYRYLDDQSQFHLSAFVSARLGQ